MWQRLLSGDDEGRANSIIEGIATGLADLSAARSDGFNSPSLASGDAGIALFFAELEKARLQPSLDAVAWRFLHRALDFIANSPSPPSLFSGGVGTGWVESVLGSDVTLASPDPDNSSSIASQGGDDIAAAVLAYLREPAVEGIRFDLMDGVAGLAEFGLRRVAESDACGTPILEAAVSSLSDHCERAPHGVAWRMPLALVGPRAKSVFREGEYAFGVAHGIAGVLPVLARIRETGVAVDEAGDLLSGATDFLLAHRLGPGSPRVFPASTMKADDTDIMGLSWCWGDLGIGVALANAAIVSQDNELLDTSLRACRGAAERGLHPYNVKDASICHGLAGTAHMFNRLFQATNERLFCEAAQHWYRRLLDLCKPGSGYGGYVFHVPLGTGETGLDASPGYLTGSAGVGLALIAAITSHEPHWDRPLGIDLRPLID
jgi:lantibiotic modifying enzyme